MNLVEESTKYLGITLNDRQLCDLELILNGGFNPLDGFMIKNDYENCINNMRLANGEIWPIPIVLHISEEIRDKLIHLDYVTLKDQTGIPIAIMDITNKNSVFKPDLETECKNVYGAYDENHPYVNILMEYSKLGLNYCCGGEIVNYQMPIHYDFIKDRLTPSETKQFFIENKWKKIIGFQTRNPMHRSHYELTKYAMNEVGDDAKLLLHPVVGITQNCDVNYHTRVRCYKKLMDYYEPNTAKLCLLPLSMRMAGPREAVWHAIIRKNYGCTHFVVGRDHAGPSYKTKEGNDFYGPYDAQELLMQHADEIGIKVITSKMIVYAISKETNIGKSAPIDKVDKDKYDIMNISGTQQRDILRAGGDLPEWFSFPNVVDELREDFKPLHQHGFCLYFIGLSGCGKSTLANAVETKLKELIRGRNTTLLDADIVRLNLSKGLGFSKEDRSTNIRRIGYLCSEITKHYGIVLAANIAPYEEDRIYNRKLVTGQGAHYIEIFVDTPLEECEARDCKGLYKAARAGTIKQFTGISDPFEQPEHSDLIVNGIDPNDKNVNKVIDLLIKKQLL